MKQVHSANFEFNQDSRVFKGLSFSVSLRLRQRLNLLDLGFDVIACIELQVENEEIKLLQNLVLVN